MTGDKLTEHLLRHFHWTPAEVLKYLDWREAVWYDFV